MSDNTRYSEATAVAAEGARVGFITCMECGATLLVDPRGPDPIVIHDAWHDTAPHKGDTDHG